MAKENITRFFDAAMTDMALAAKVAALAAEHGYDFTVEELLEFGAARPISDDDVEHVAGGAMPPGYRAPRLVPKPQYGYDENGNRIRIQ